MTREDARKALLLYRPGTADAAEPEITEALAFARQDPELSQWLEQYCAQQEIIRAKIREIPIPAGLKEQIISERPRVMRERFARRALVLAMASICLVVIGWWAAVSWQRPPADDTYANYRSRMVSAALRGYSMDLETNSLAQIRDYLQKNHAADNCEIPAGLKKAEATGCAIERWQGANVGLLCFRAGKPLASGKKNDLWLFVVDRALVKGAPNSGEPQFVKVNKLMTATWSLGDKLYLLGAAGDEQSLRQWF